MTHRSTVTLAFLLLVSSKLYVVTRGALVPEMARTDQFREHAEHVGDAGWPNELAGEEKGFAGFNAQLTLLGTLVGLIAARQTIGSPDEMPPNMPPWRLVCV